MKNPIIGFLRVNEAHKDVFSVGKYSYVADNSSQLNFYRGSKCKLSIGSFVSIGSNVHIFVGGEHHTDWISTYHFSEVFDDVEKKECIKTKGDIVIGSDVWIGNDVIVLSGVTIGHGAVVGAGSVVSKNVEPYSIVAGNPIREIGKRFTEEQREGLLRIKWWEWEDEEINKIIPWLMSSNVDKLIRYGLDKLLTKEEE